MKDYLQQTLEIGDYVITVDPDHRILMLGQVVKFAKKTVKIKYRNKYYDPDSKSKWCAKYLEKNAASDALCRVPESDVLIYILKTYGE